MSYWEPALAAMAVLAALPGAATALHLAFLAAASLGYREPLLKPAGARFLVIIPAHNEERSLPATLSAIRSQLRQGDCVLVVADHCSDGTADVARRYGAEVLENSGAEPGGRAEARQRGVELALGWPDWEAVIFLDADSVVQPGFVDAVDGMFAAGAKAVQARSEAALEGRGLVAQASIAAFTVQGITMPRGRDRLGLSVRLRGTGMAVRREVVSSHRFRAPASEDLWYSLDLCLEDILPRHIDSARLRSQNVSDWPSFSRQRVRYEAGRMSAAREFVPRLLRHRTWASLEAAWHAATLPLAPAAASLMVGVLLAATLRSWVVLPIIAALGLLAAVVVVGLLQAKANWKTWVALAAAPLYVPYKVALQLVAAARLLEREPHYGPTPRT